MRRSEDYAELDAQIARLTAERDEARQDLCALWDLLRSMPSGPGEGMDSDAEDVKAQAEWNERFRAMEAKLAIALCLTCGNAHTKASGCPVTERKE